MKSRVWRKTKEKRDVERRRVDEENIMTLILFSFLCMLCARSLLSPPFFVTYFYLLFLLCYFSFFSPLFAFAVRLPRRKTSNTDLENVFIEGKSSSSYIKQIENHFKSRGKFKMIKGDREGCLWLVS